MTADLLDELRIDLVPTTLGSGTRFLEGLTTSPAFTDLETITGTGTGVTRLIYQLPDPARSPAHPLTRSPALPLSRSPAS